MTAHKQVQVGIEVCDFVSHSDLESSMSGPRKSAAAPPSAVVKQEAQATRGGNAYLQLFEDIRTKELARLSQLSTTAALRELEAAIRPLWSKASETVRRKKVITTKQPDGSTKRELSRYSTKIKRIDDEHSAQARQHIEQLLKKNTKSTEQQRTDLTEALILLKQLQAYNVNPGKLHEQGCIPAWYQELTGISDCANELIDISGEDDERTVCADIDDDNESNTEASSSTGGNAARNHSTVKRELVEHQIDHNMITSSSTDNAAVMPSSSVSTDVDLTDIQKVTNTSTPAIPVAAAANDGSSLVAAALAAVDGTAEQQQTKNTAARNVPVLPAAAAAAAAVQPADTDPTSYHDNNNIASAGDAIKPKQTRTLTLGNGSTYVGTVKCGQPHGIGTEQMPDGSTYTGNWLNGVKQGQGTLVIVRNSIILSTYVGEFYNDVQRQGQTLPATGRTYSGAVKECDSFVTNKLIGKTAADQQADSTTELSSQAATANSGEHTHPTISNNANRIETELRGVQLPDSSNISVYKGSSDDHIEGKSTLAASSTLLHNASQGASALKRKHDAAFVSDTSTSVVDSGSTLGAVAEPSQSITDTTASTDTSMTTQDAIGVTAADAAITGSTDESLNITVPDTDVNCDDIPIVNLKKQKCSDSLNCDVNTRSTAVISNVVQKLSGDGNMANVDDNAMHSGQPTEQHTSKWVRRNRARTTAKTTNSRWTKARIVKIVTAPLR
jgi:hypothetical protein